MAKKKSSSFFHFFLIISLFVMISLSTVGASGNHREHGSWAAVKPGGCQGSAECMGEGEFDIDLEIKRRKLDYYGNFICYGALESDYVPCSIRGQSYYNCQADGVANPYSRGCSAITQCRSDYYY